MSLAQLGVARPSAERTDGWAWAGDEDSVTASRLSDFVAAALQADAERAGAPALPNSPVRAAPPLRRRTDANRARGCTGQELWLTLHDRSGNLCEELSPVTQDLLTVVSLWEDCVKAFAVRVGQGLGYRPLAIHARPLMLRVSKKQHASMLATSTGD